MLGRTAELIDRLVEGRPPRNIDRHFGWLREYGYEVIQSGSRGMAHYVTYATRDVLVHVGYDYHYGHVAVEIGSRRQLPIRPLDLGKLLVARAPGIIWDSNYDIDARGALEAKLTRGAGLTREHFADLLRGENIGLLEQDASASHGSP